VRRLVEADRAGEDQRIVVAGLDLDPEDPHDEASDVS
jgi:hypothetical protein